MEECSNNMERLLAISLSHNGATPVTLASNTYDALGRLAACSVNNGGISTAYAYNVRGWVQSVTNAHFYEWIHYQDAPSGGTPFWGGGFSGITWLQCESLKAATSVENQYKFSYDGLNRLTKADFSSSGEQWNGDLISQGDRDFSCSYAYDLNGNMKSLRRYGVSLYNTSLPTHIRNYGIIDDLTMAYDGNRLKSVSDAAEEPTYAGAMDFRDGADGAEEYTYDANGNMTSDRNKGISSITYNMLNLPQTVLFEDGHETCYTYAADGRKLRVEYRLNNFSIIEAEKAKASDGYDAIASPSALDVNGIIETPAEPISRTLMTRDYCGNYIYKNGYMQDGELYFYIKDYQGNVRVVLNQANQPVEVNSYYPYGGLMAATTTEGTQPYKYSAKELDRENGLDLYDSQARHYDPIIPRTTTMDPKSETYYPVSPYTWCAANPLKYIDFDGNELSVTGKQKNIDYTINQINAITPGVHFYVSDSQSNISYFVYDKNTINDNSKMMMNIVDDKKIRSMIRVVDNHTFAKREFFGGGFFGCNLNEDNTISTLNVMNNSDISKIEQFSKAGTSVLHEVTESYIAGKLASILNTNVSPAIEGSNYLQNFVYNIAHLLASPQVPLYSDKQTDADNVSHEIIYIKDEQNQPVVIHTK